MAMSTAEQLAVLDESIRNQEGELGFYSSYGTAYQKALAELNATKKTREELVGLMAQQQVQPVPIDGSGGPSWFIGTSTSKYIWWAVGGVAVLGIVAYLLRKKS